MPEEENSTPVEAARDRIVDNWMELICNGPGLDDGEERELFEDAHLVAVALKQQTERAQAAEAALEKLRGECRRIHNHVRWTLREVGGEFREVIGPMLEEGQ